MRLAHFKKASEKVRGHIMESELKLYYNMNPCLIQQKY